ncbi:MAG: diguanylate cyclase [Syntrophomonadaceae bacterium]|nr:diguanylate cyclase [Syntrophomonadaceae bacterium]
MEGSWVKSFPVAVTICDHYGVILEMNDRAAEVFAKRGGRELVGKNVLYCHPQSAREKLAELLKRGGTNCYTTENNGVKRLVYQAPWYKDGEYQGLVELLFEIPADMPHFVRGE